MAINNKTLVRLPIVAKDRLELHLCARLRIQDYAQHDSTVLLLYYTIVTNYAIGLIAVGRECSFFHTIELLNSIAFRGFRCWQGTVIVWLLLVDSTHVTVTYQIFCYRVY